MNRILLHHVHILGVLVLRLMSIFFRVVLCIQIGRCMVNFQKIKITTRIYEHYTTCAPEEAGMNGHRTTWDSLVYSVWVPVRGPFLLSG